MDQNEKDDELDPDILQRTHSSPITSPKNTTRTQEEDGPPRAVTVPLHNDQSSDLLQMELAISSKLQWNKMKVQRTHSSDDINPEGGQTTTTVPAMQPGKSREMSYGNDGLHETHNGVHRYGDTIEIEMADIAMAIEEIEMMSDSDINRMSVDMTAPAE